MNHWEEVKKGGSQHYKEGEVEPIDLYRSGGILLDWAIGEIMSHAFRNRGQITARINPKDFEKIKHYAEIILADYQEAMKKLRGK